MENAVWNGKVISAIEIAQDYSLEKDIRRASKNKEIRCPDTECRGILKYCHGEIKGAYFAHLDSGECDYARFDASDNAQLCNLRRKLYEVFKGKGYDVQLEAKVLEHHYTHILVTLESGERIAIELGSKRTGIQQIEELAAEYNSKGITVIWIVVGDAWVQNKREDSLYFLKRYVLNESLNNDCIIIDYNGGLVKHCKYDKNKYVYEGRDLSSKIGEQIFVESAKMADLYFEGNQLTTVGFDREYLFWLKAKNYRFEAEKERVDAEEREKQKRMAEKANMDLRSRYMSMAPKKRQPVMPKTVVRQNTFFNEVRNVATKPVADRKSEIMSIIDQQERQARDSTGVRWIRCERCGEVDTEDNFYSYGGTGHINLGVCNKCDKKKQ